MSPVALTKCPNRPMKVLDATSRFGLLRRFERLVWEQRPAQLAQVSQMCARALSPSAVDAAGVVDQLPTAGSGPNSRTSCAQRQAAAILAAHCSASSSEGTSMIVTPAMYALLSAPSVTVPSGATTLGLTSPWGYTPPANTHTPASWASRITASDASLTAGPPSPGSESIPPSSNENSYRVN